MMTLGDNFSEHYHDNVIQTSLRKYYSVSQNMDIEDDGKVYKVS